MGLLSRWVVAHLFGVHATHVFVFAVAADTVEAGAVVDGAVLGAELVDGVTITEVGCLQ